MRRVNPGDYVWLRGGVVSGYGSGPWTSDRGQLTTTIYDARGYPVAITLARPDRAGNTKLIAAAPELLEVLKRLERAWSTPAPNWAALTFAELPNVRAAIAKATT